MAWLNLNREDRDSKDNRARHERVTKKRLRQVFSSGNRVQGADPEEVEARLRNLSHGTYRVRSGPAESVNVDRRYRGVQDQVSHRRYQDPRP